MNTDEHGYSDSLTERVLAANSSRKSTSARSSQNSACAASEPVPKLLRRGLYAKVIERVRQQLRDLHRIPPLDIAPVNHMDRLAILKNRDRRR